MHTFGSKPDKPQSSLGQANACLIINMGASRILSPHVPCPGFTWYGTVRRVMFSSSLGTCSSVTARPLATRRVKHLQKRGNLA